jgi:cytochrome oxidase Cu insertion factor (SCO1/SenC/PrrC family)
MKRTVSVFLTFVSLCGILRADEPKVAVAAPTTSTIPDTIVVTSRGERLHFKSELIKGRIAVINFIYADCQRICPLQGKTFARLSTALGDRLGKEVVLISISLAPKDDTPEVLAQWGARFGAGREWNLLAVEERDLWPLVHSLAAAITAKSEHDATAVVWREGAEPHKLYGLDTTASFIEAIDSLKIPAHRSIKSAAN